MPDPATNNRFTIGLDADDTLWDNQEMFEAGEALLRELLLPWADGQTTNEALLHDQRQTLGIYGYGVKSFVLSMIATAIEISESQISHADLQKLIDCGKDILTAPVALLTGVPETVVQLAETYNLLLITKGDLHHQNRKIVQSGLLPLLVGAEVVDEKSPATYQEILDRYGIDPARFVMVGNSMRSDIEPVLAIGAQAIHIPYHLTWHLEHGSNHGSVRSSPPHHELAHFVDLPATLATLCTLSG